MKIYAFHLLNDYSGSPKVLMQLLKGWQKKGLDVNVVTCSGREGFLSDIEGVSYTYYWYRWSARPLMRLVNFALSQVFLFFRLLFVLRKDDIVYINTILPFGAAFLGKLRGCRVIYHVHETTMKPAMLKKFLFGVMRIMADDVIFVSESLAQQEKVETAHNHVIYNAIENTFLGKAMVNRIGKTGNRDEVLMVCSLKDYKGVFEYLDLADMNEKYHFSLVLNARQEEIDAFFASENIPANLSMYPTQTNLHPFYNKADVILNLSRPDGWIETFGLTIIEGMAYGLPAIVPPVGGIAELVTDGVNGYQVSSRNLGDVSEKLGWILDRPELYSIMKDNAINKINAFKEDSFIDKSLEVLEHKFQRVALKYLREAGV